MQQCILHHCQNCNLRNKEVNSLRPTQKGRGYNVATRQRHAFTFTWTRSCRVSRSKRVGIRLRTDCSIRQRRTFSEDAVICRLSTNRQRLHKPEGQFYTECDVGLVGPVGPGAAKPSGKNGQKCALSVPSFALSFAEPEPKFQAVLKPTRSAFVGLRYAIRKAVLHRRTASDWPARCLYICQH